MNERLTSALLAAAAVVMVWLLFLPKPGAEPALSRPLTGDLEPSGLQAVWRWLQGEHIPLAALRSRFDQLGHSYPKGNLLLLSLPFESPPKHGEIESLHAWVRRGNTLVVLAALDDTPPWAAVSAQLLKSQVEDVSGLKISNATAREGTGRQLRRAMADFTAGLDSELHPRGTHPLMKGVTSLRVVSELPASRWGVTPKSGVVLNLAGLKDGDEPALWLQLEGEGQVVTSAFAGIFSNANVARADNGRLLSNLIARSVMPGGTVLFDDAHQGAPGVMDAKRFYSDPRLHRTLLWLILLWLVFALGIQGPRRHAPQWRPQDITAFIAMSGDFLASTTEPGATAGRLLANFFNHIHRRLNQREDGTPAWRWLIAQRDVDPRQVAQLRECHRRLESGRRVDLVKLQNLLSQLQEQIT